MSMKNSDDTIGKQIRHLLACGAVPQPTASPRAPFSVGDGHIMVLKLAH